MDSKSKDFSEILEPVYTCVEALLLQELKESKPTMEFTKRDIIVVSMLYGIVIKNKQYHRFTKSGLDIESAKNISAIYNELLKSLTLGTTGVDVSEFFGVKE